MPIQMFKSKAESWRKMRRRLVDQARDLKSGKWMQRTILSEGETIPINGAEFRVARIDYNGKVILRATPKSKAAFFREKARARS